MKLNVIIYWLLSFVFIFILLGFNTDSLLASSSSSTSASNSTSSVPCVNLTNDLWLGKEGSDVERLQSFLVENKYLSSRNYDKTVGVFDSNTKRAVSRYQGKQKIRPSTGFVGTVTRNALSCNPIMSSSKIPQGYVYCAEEGGSCSFSGYRGVIFVAENESESSYTIAKNSVTCDKELFYSDSSPDVQGRKCYYSIEYAGGASSTVQNLSQQASCKFDPLKYADYYSDVKKSFGTNIQRIKRHWISYGIKEGRTPCGNDMPTCRFNDGVYMSLHNDLISSVDDGYRHYRYSGLNENRDICRLSKSAVSSKQDIFKNIKEAIIGFFVNPAYAQAPVSPTQGCGSDHGKTFSGDIRSVYKTLSRSFSLCKAGYSPSSVSYNSFNSSTGRYQSYPPSNTITWQCRERGKFGKTTRGGSCYATVSQTVSSTPTKNWSAMTENDLEYETWKFNTRRTAIFWFERSYDF